MTTKEISEQHYYDKRRRGTLERQIKELLKIKCKEQREICAENFDYDSDIDSIVSAKEPDFE